MKGYRLYLMIEGKEVLFASYDQNNPQESSNIIFNENFNENQNSSYEFSFSFIEKREEEALQKANIFKYLRIGRTLRLYLNDSENYIKFIIISLSPESFQENTLWQVGLQDYASFKWSKNSLGLTFDTSSDEGWDEDNINVLNIGNYILKRTNLQKNILERDNLFIELSRTSGGQKYPFAKYDGKNLVFYNRELNFYTNSQLEFNQSGELDINDDKEGNLIVEGFHFKLKNFFDDGIIDSQSGDFSLKLGNNIIYENSFTVDSPLVFDLLPLDGLIEEVNYSQSIVIKNKDFLKIEIRLSSAGSPELGYEVLYSEKNPHYSTYAGALIFSIGDYVDSGGYRVCTFSYTDNLKNHLSSFYSDPLISFYIVNSNETIDYDLPNEDKFNIEYLKGWKIKDLSETEPYKQKVNLEVSDSNTYNALIELSNLTNSLVDINYEDKEIKFISKKDISNKSNYFLSPEVNLQEISLNYIGNTISPILNVSGGEDEYGSIVSLIPLIPSAALEFFTRLYNETSWIITDFHKPDIFRDFFKEENMGSWQHESITVPFNTLEEKEENSLFLDVLNKLPYLDSFLINVDYFKNNNLLSEADYQVFMKKIYNDLRMINFNFQNISKIKNKLEYLIWDYETRINNLVEIIAPSLNSGNYSNNQYDLEKIFYLTKRGSKFIEYTTELDLSSYENWRIEFPIKVLVEDGAVIEINSENSVIYKNTDNTKFKYVVNFKKEDFLIENTFSIDVKAERYEFDNEEWGNKKIFSLDFSVGNTGFKISYDLEEQETKGEFPYFSVLNRYKGIEEIYKKFNELSEKIKNYIKKREEAIYKLNRLDYIQISEALTQEQEIEKADLMSDIDMYEAVVGDWSIDNFGNIIEGNSYGSLCVLYKEFKKNLERKEYTNFPVPPLEPILTKYNNILNEKQDFLFDLKKEFGDIWIEGFYENSLETDWRKLYNEAILYFLDYKEPEPQVSLTYIDLSQVIGKNLKDIRVGNTIKINNIEGILNNKTIELVVNSITRDLRNPSGITLTVSKRELEDEILQKLLIKIKE